VTNGPKLAATEGYRGGQQPVSPSSARSSKLNADPLFEKRRLEDHLAAGRGFVGSVDRNSEVATPVGAAHERLSRCGSELPDVHRVGTLGGDRLFPRVRRVWCHLMPGEVNRSRAARAGRPCNGWRKSGSPLSFLSWRFEPKKRKCWWIAGDQSKFGLTT
jgi:hypothetical protein